MAHKPNVIIFGGSNSLGPQLALYLVPLKGEAIVSHLRVVDKFSIFPATTYVGKDFPQLLQERKDVIEYRQANLTVPATVAKCFTDPAPNGLPYTHVFDLTGEHAYDRPAAVQISQTFNVSLSIAREAAKQGTVKAYVRGAHSFYDQFTEKKKYKEEDAEGWKPLGTRGVWWHEMLRAVASVPNLPLVILRVAYLYGPGEIRGEITTVFLCGLVYKHLDREMRFLWTPKIKRNTIHSRDVVGAGWAAAEWAAGLDRQKMNALAGVSLPPSGDADVKGVESAIKKEQGGVIAPVFNLVDDGDTDQERLGLTCEKVFGVKHGFQRVIMSQLAKMKFSQIVEEVNEMHLTEWARITGTLAVPPVPSTPLNPYAEPHMLQKHGCALDGEKLQKVIGYKLTRPYLNEDTVRETIDAYRAAGIWPEVPQLSA